MALNYGNIKKTDIANGIGIRVSLFVSGCTRHCKNCFNSETWDAGITAKDASIPKPGISITAIHLQKKQKMKL